MVASALPALPGGRRIVCLRDALDDALRSALVIAEFQELRNMLASLQEDHVICAYSAYDQVLHLVRAHSQAEFQVIAEEAQLPSKLHDLERLCEEQGIRPDGTQASTEAAVSVQPEEVVRRCRVRAKRGEAQALRQQLGKYAQLEAELAVELAAKRVEVLERAAAFEPVAAQLAQAGADCLQLAVPLETVAA